MTRQKDLAELVRHADEMVTLESFDYRVVDDEVGGELDAALRIEVPRWIGSDWPFEAPRSIGVDLTWAEWLALPDLA